MAARQNSEQKALAQYAFRRRWLNALRAAGVLTIGQLRVPSEHQLLEVANVRPQERRGPRPRAPGPGP
jgi:hypothetical protein